VSNESIKKDIFQGVIPLGTTKTPYKIASTFAVDRYDEAADNLIKFLQCNIALVVDIEKKIIFIKLSNCTLHAGNFASKLFEGGGVETVAIGKVNNVFIKISKLLYPVA
jgi:hypothetical protein